MLKVKCGGKKNWNDRKGKELDEKYGVWVIWHAAVVYFKEVKEK